jgi:hypothetical protein
VTFIKAAHMIMTPASKDFVTLLPYPLYKNAVHSTFFNRDDENENGITMLS